MSLLVHLAWRFVAVVLLCLAGTALWIMRDAGDALRLETQTSAERVARLMGRQPGLGSSDRGYRSDDPAGPHAPAILAVLPGICVTVTIGSGEARRSCSGWDGLGLPAPGWFRFLVEGVFVPPAPFAHPIVYRDRVIGRVDAWPESDVAAARAWHRIKTALVTTAGMGGAIGILAAFAAAQLLAPVGTIVRSLQSVEIGSIPPRLPIFPVREFDSIAKAFDAMTERLAESHAERTRLTLRLFQVQDEERRVLARDLHDAFGQYLTAAGVVAASIEAGAADRIDLAEDAKAIARITAEMSDILRSALARLDPPELKELGFEGSLRALVAGWQAQKRAAATFHLDIDGDWRDVPPHAALALYRIVQELLTNAMRHGSSTRVFVRVSRADGSERPVTLIVDDDGGGDPASLHDMPGRGLLGIRERISALGGHLSLTGSENGIRASAMIPTGT